MRIGLRASMALLLGAAWVGCRRGKTAAITSDPTPPDARIHDVSPRSTAPSLALLHGQVIDLKTQSLLSGLEPDTPMREATQLGGVELAYLVNRRLELNAYDMRSGKRRWSLPKTGCALLAGIQAGALCANGASVVVFDATSGAPRTLTSTVGAGVTQLLPIALGARFAVARDDRSVTFFDGVTLAELGRATLPFVAFGFRQGLEETEQGVCGAVADPDLILVCLESSGALRFTKTIPLRKPTDPSSTTFLVRQLDRRFVVASTMSSWSSSVTRGVVVRLDDGAEVARIEEEIAAAVTADDGALDGLLVTQPPLRGVRLFEASGALRWTSSASLQEAASAVSIGDALIVGTFHRNTSGADLRAFDRSTGASRWHGDVSLLPIAHSRYHNDVRLTVAFGHVVMRGEEASQSYLEIFAPSDGTRKLSELRPL